MSRLPLYRWCVRPLLFRLEAERAHVATLRACRWIGRTPAGRMLIRGMYGYEDPRLRVSISGIEFPSPIALAPGFDKNGIAVEALGALGFGAIEVGSVSAYPSLGNSQRPRLFRIPADEGLIVFYGVPNDGADAIAARLARVRLPVPLGVSLVETNTGTSRPVDAVIGEIATAAKTLRGCADYFALNLNCPNSAGGFSHFDEPSRLRALLAALEEVAGLPPVFLRVTPPHDARGIEAILEAIDPFPFVRALSFYDPKNNLRARLRTPATELARMPGSVAAPIALAGMQATLREWYRRIDRKRLALIGVGGIRTAEDVYRTIRLGASLVQVYTALVYGGPGLVPQLKRGLVSLLERDGIRRLSDAIGADNAVAR